MIPPRYRELLTNEVVGVLERIRDEILQESNDLRAQETRPGFLNPTDLEARAKKIFNRVEGEKNVLSLPRRIRLLRHRAVRVYGIDPGGVLDTAPTLEWFAQIVENIESELDSIDRKRVMWLTLMATALALLAVVLAVTLH